MPYPGQKNLRAQRVVRQEDSRGWTYVSVPGRFKPVRHNYSQNSETYYVAMVDLEPRKTKEGGYTKNHDVVHVRAKTVRLLREEIEKRWPNAVFSIDNPDLMSDPRKAHAAEVKAEQEAQQAELDKQDMARRVVEQHKAFANSMTAEQVAEYRNIILQRFINDTSWNAWFREHPKFLAWPNDEGKNRAVLLKYCGDHGFRVPNHDILDRGMRYLLDNSHFYMSERRLRSTADTVQEYTGQPLVRSVRSSSEPTREDLRTMDIKDLRRLAIKPANLRDLRKGY